ncbi:MAG: GDP-L-fucose synthase family protein [Mycobacteriales bacterium]
MSESQPFHHPLPADAKIYVAGHRGLVGSAIWRRLERAGHGNLIGVPSTDLDLRDRTAVDDFFDTEKPEYVFLAAAKVGGILGNKLAPADFLSENLRIQVNVLDAAARIGVRRLLFLGSSCIYPKFAPQPISEDSLLTGKLEETNDAYAIAKIAGVMQVQALRRQHGSSFVSVMPTNLYGPNDNFDLTTAHVLPMFIRKFHEARESGGPVTVWGSGTPRREFLHADDLADASLFVLEHYDSPDPVNIGVGRDISIAELVELVADVVGYDGPVEWDRSKPDGTPRKLLDVSRLTALGWTARIGLREGIRATYQWYVDNRR